MTDKIRYGKTEQEARLAEAFTDMGIPCETNAIVCFLCGQHFRNLSPGEYPHSCTSCHASYNAPMQYCMPDLLLPSRPVKAIVFVNGSVHDKARVRKKDKAQIAVLRGLGYEVFVATNYMIDRAEQTNLRLYALGIQTAINNPALYVAAYNGEREIVGF
jgi:hypothetical protein